MKPDATASRWARIAVLKANTPPDHEWAKLHDSLVVVPMIEAPQDRANWRIFDPEGILDRLETSAIDHGLMEPGAPPLVDPAYAIAQLWRSSRGIKEIVQK